MRLGRFEIRDGGEDLLDDDDTATTLKAISFDITNFENLETVAIFDGTTNLAETSVSSNVVSFDNLNIIATDGSSKSFTIYGTFKTTVTDNAQIQFTVASATSDIAGSTFLSTNAGGAQTSIDGDKNRIEVTASAIAFDQQPSDVALYEVMTPAPTVIAVDVNGNVDLDYNETVTIFAFGLENNPEYDFVNGTAVLDSLIFTDAPFTPFGQQLNAFNPLGSDQSDTFNLTGDIFDGLVYNGGWVGGDSQSPIARPNENVLIVSGTYGVFDNIEVINLTILDGANVIIPSQESITASETVTIVNGGSLILNSASTGYSSLIANDVVGNVTYNRHVNKFVPGSATGNNDYIAAPVTSADQTFIAFRTVNTDIPSGTINQVPSFLFGPFNNITDTWDYFSDTDDPVIELGIGYQTASTADNGSLFEFQGNVETGSVEKDISVGPATGSIFNSIGNPYPSYLALSSFLAENNDAFDPDTAGIYGYNGFTDPTSNIQQYEVWNQSYLDDNPSAVIAPGQGFLVSSKPEGGSINFTPDMRVIGTTDDFIAGRPSTSNPQNASLKLNISNNTNNFYTSLYFNENASRGMDVGYDAAFFNRETPEFALYSHLVENNNGTDMTVQTLAYNDLNQVIIPLGVNANQGQELQFSILGTNIPEGINVFLEDNASNTFTNLRTGDYSLVPSTSLNGTGRFYIHVSNQQLSIADNRLNGLDIFTDATRGELIIKGQLEAQTQLQLIDIQGRIVLNQALNATLNTNTVNVANLDTGVYIVQLVNDSANRTQKIILK